MLIDVNLSLVDVVQHKGKEEDSCQISSGWTDVFVINKLMIKLGNNDGF